LIFAVKIENIVLGITGAKVVSVDYDTKIIRLIVYVPCSKGGSITEFREEVDAMADRKRGIVCRYLEAEGFMSEDTSKWGKVEFLDEEAEWRTHTQTVCELA
jgi:hypothetical protein